MLTSSRSLSGPRLVKADNSKTRAAELLKLNFRSLRMGELLLNGVYLPLDNDRHQFDAHFFHNQAEIAMLSALYQPSKNHQVSGTMTLSQLPLKMLNPFLGETGRMQGCDERIGGRGANDG